MLANIACYLLLANTVSSQLLLLVTLANISCYLLLAYTVGKQTVS